MSPAALGATASICAPVPQREKTSAIRSSRARTSPGHSYPGADVIRAIPAYSTSARVRSGCVAA